MENLPLPLFTRESAIQKVRLAEDSWNSRDPGKVALAHLRHYLLFVPCKYELERCGIA